uniref:Uncharacterized protein n=1 Tax=Arundo donax TaxID=35708 RepID=A0A0A9G8K0_ARUDO
MFVSYCGLWSTIRLCKQTAGLWNRITTIQAWIMAQSTREEILQSRGNKHALSKYRNCVGSWVNQHQDDLPRVVN